MTDSGVRAACAVARAQGLRFDDPVVLRDRSNLLVHLRPAPVVARVASATSLARPGPAWLEREVLVARHLAARDAPVVRPSPELDPGPHGSDGHWLSFWEYLPEHAAAVDPEQAGRALRACHDALVDLADPLPALERPRETARELARLAAEDAFGADGAWLEELAARWLSDVAALDDARAVHGDAHLGNVLWSSRGALWGDWEDTFAGPLAWDFACLIAPERITGRDGPRIQAALAAHGAPPDADAIELCLVGRALQWAVWNVLLGRAHPPLQRELLTRTVAWLAERR